jgi:hypothetical protein
MPSVVGSEDNPAAGQGELEVVQNRRTIPSAHATLASTLPSAPADPPLSRAFPVGCEPSKCPFIFTPVRSDGADPISRGNRRAVFDERVLEIGIDIGWSAAGLQGKTCGREDKSAQCIRPLGGDISPGDDEFR